MTLFSRFWQSVLPHSERRSPAPLASAGWTCSHETLLVNAILTSENRRLFSANHFSLYYSEVLCSPITPHNSRRFISSAFGYT